MYIFIYLSSHFFTDPYKNTSHFIIMDIYDTIIVGGDISGLYAG